MAQSYPRGKEPGIRRATYITGAIALLCLLLASSAEARHPNIPIRNVPPACLGGFTYAAEFRPWSKAVWKVERWRRGEPKAATIAAYHRKLRCAAGPGNRQAMLAMWRADRRRFYAHRSSQLAALNIDHRWAPHWAPDWSGPTLPPYLIAALAEEAGKLVGVDVPGWTMEQVTEGESTRRPGSAAVDVGGTKGYGLWAITWPFADDILARYGWTYEDMWNPVPNAIVMAEIYARQGIRAWYGIRFVTDWNRHYRGQFDLRLVLGGRSLRQAVH